MPVLVPHLGIYAVAYTRAFNGALDYAGIFEFLKVLGSCSLRQAYLLYQISAYAGVLLHELLKYRNSCRVGNGFGHIGKIVLLPGEKGGFCRSHIAILRLIFTQPKFISK
jgi:hypothetical protein